ncbi:hypothetical protein OC861_005272 [Tilletia horrida]|nr:hypothetical protein OC861_005272 [Tilletia horrida]
MAADSHHRQQQQQQRQQHSPSSSLDSSSSSSSLTRDPVASAQRTQEHPSSAGSAPPASSTTTHPALSPFHTLRPANSSTTLFNHPATAATATAQGPSNTSYSNLNKTSTAPSHYTTTSSMYNSAKASAGPDNSISDHSQRVIHFQPHTQAPRIALTDPLADMREHNLSRPHGLGENSDWPDSHRIYHSARPAPATNAGVAAPHSTGTFPDSQQQPPPRPGFYRQPSDMSVNGSDMDAHFGDDADRDPDDYAWSDDEDVEDSAKFEEEKAKELRVGGKGRLSLWKILRFLITTFLGNFIISCILIVPVLVMQFYYRKHLPPYVDSDSPQANALRNHQDYVADNVQASFIWAAFNLHMMWWIHIGVEIFPRTVLFLVRAIWGSASQRLLGLAEFYASIKHFIKPVFYAAMSWGSWAVIYGTSLYDLYNHGNPDISRASYTPRLYQVVEFFFFFILTVCAEKILIKFIAMKFHTSAYAERLAKVAQALQVFDLLRDYRPTGFFGGAAGGTASGSRPGTPSGMFAPRFGRAKASTGPTQTGSRPGSGSSTPVRMDAIPYNKDVTDASFSSPDNSLAKRKHADRRPAYFAVEGDLGADGMADDEDVEGKQHNGTTGSKTLVDRKGSGSGSSSSDAQLGQKRNKHGLSLQKLFHPHGKGSSSSTIEDPNTGIELDAQTGMPLRYRSNFDGQEGSTPAGSGVRHAGKDRNKKKQGISGDELRDAMTSSTGKSSRRSRVRQRALATASQARAIARVVMNDPKGLLSNSQLLGGFAADVTGPAEAKRLARSIFKNFRGSHRRRYLVEADFEPAFESKEEAKKAFAVFDRDGNGDISQAEIKNTVLAVYKERRFLSRSVQDVHHAVSTLDLVILSLAMLIVLFEALAIFNINITKMVTTVYTLGLAFAFIFKQTASNVFDSIVFLFVTHAYDTGDRIMLGEQIMVVKRMSLLSTQFTLADGGYQWESVPIQVPFDTPLEKLDAVEEDMKHWLATEPERMFEPSTSIVPQHIDNMRSISCTVGMTHRANWQDWGARFARRNAFYAALSYYCKKHGVRYATSLQPVVYWEEEETGLPPSYTDASEVDPQNKQVWVPDEANDDFAPSPPPSPAPGGASGPPPTGKPKNLMGFTPPPDEIEGSGLRMRKARRSEKKLVAQGGD